MKPRFKHERGFTLVEMTVGLLIAALLTLGLFQIFNSTNRSYQRGTETLDGQQNARAALNWIAKELRSAKGFNLAQPDEVTFLTDANVPNQMRTFRLDTADQDGDGDVSELLLIRNPADDGTPGVYLDEIAVGVDSLVFVYRDGLGNPTASRASVQEVEIIVFAQGNRMGREIGATTHGGHEVAMATRVRCRNLGKSVPTLGDVTAPLPPTGLVANMGCGTATLSWTANAESDVAGYFLAYDRGSGGSPYSGTDADQGPSPIYVGNATQYTLTGLDLTSTYYFNLQVVDAADNISMWGNEVNGVAADTYPPATPTNLVARVVANDEISLEWVKSPDWDVATYRLTWEGDDAPGVPFTRDTPYPYALLSGLQPDATYTCSVTAVDGCGNESAPTAAVTITLVPCDDDVTFPAMPQNVATQPADESVRITWDKVNDTDVVGYEIYFSHSDGSTQSTLMVSNVDNYTVYGLENGETYFFQVSAVDGCGHVGPFSGSIGGTPIRCSGFDAPPSAPSNLTASDVGVGDQVDLSWTAVSDGDLLGYRVHWGPSPGTYHYSVDVGESLFWTVSGLTTGTVAYFAVTAYDICGNESTFSSSASAVPTWGCICPPTVNTDTPASYAVLAGRVAWQVSAAACSTSSVDFVEFKIDGSTRFVDYSAPFEYGSLGTGWETFVESDGPHTLVALVQDASGCRTTDTTQVYVDNSAAGPPCVGIANGDEGELGGAYDQVISVDITNFSSVQTYKMDALVLEWTSSGMMPIQIVMDGSSVWSAPAARSPGDTLWLASTYDVPPGSVVRMDVQFWDNPVSSMPDLDLANAGIEVTFLGNPTAACGPYPILIDVPLCDPGVTIASVNSANPYDVVPLPEIGDEYYTDRTYTLTYLPSELENSTLVRSPNNDKNTGGSHQLKLDFAQATTTYIAYDPRGTAPSWIRDNYTDTGLTIGVTDSGTSTLGLWRQDLGAGLHTFSGNKAAGWGGAVGTNYVIFVVCQE